ncbi:MAG: 4,5-dihydroxyphthalate decarboxylase [Aeromicrobium sp.]|jgi:4,5-dihydroxyphthalate decarboxylase|nr:4,5-dihydroxyphthalate decarboxylase [Aeromicrobium sp.]
MSRVPLTFACVDYDRTRALQDGRVRPEGIDLTFLALPVEETFYRQLRHREFEISEMSLSSYAMTLDLEDPPFVALPVFPSRYFRHQSMYVNTRSGIRRPEDLAGKRIGIPEYQMTASVWQRGILQDEYGVAPASMEYVTGAIEQSGRDEKLTLDLPDDIRISAIGPRDNLSAMLEEGRIDAIFSASEPSCLKRAEHVRHLFENYVEVEKEYFARTGILPIMHTVVVRRDVLEAHPWVARELVKAFDASLRIAYDDLAYRSALKTMLPWLNHHVADTVATLGEGYWDYGLEKNRHVLDTFARYSFEQGLTKKLRGADELVMGAASDSYRL